MSSGLEQTIRILTQRIVELESTDRERQFRELQEELEITKLTLVPITPTEELSDAIRWSEGLGAELRNKMNSIQLGHIVFDSALDGCRCLFDRMYEDIPKTKRGNYSSEYKEILRDLCCATMDIEEIAYMKVQQDGKTSF